MTAVLASQSSSWFFLKLKAYNDTERNIPCVVELPSMQDGNLLDVPQEWTCGIVAFSASLGSTSLFYYPQDDEMKIKYVVFENKGGDLANATPVSTQTRSVYKNSYSLGNLMDLLNPRPCDLGKIPISFFILPGGEIGLGPVASDMVKDLAHDNIQFRTDTRCTDIIMSKQLAKNMKMLGQSVSRVRAHTDHKTLLHSLFFEWTNRPRFATYKSLARWYLRVPVLATNGQQRFDASGVTIPTDVQFRILLPRKGNLYPHGGEGDYAEEQWSDQTAFNEEGKFNLDRFTGGEMNRAPLRFRDLGNNHRGAFLVWTIYKENDSDDHYLYVYRTTQIANGQRTIQMEDPIMKSIAYVFQNYVTPRAYLSQPTTPLVPGGGVGGAGVPGPVSDYRFTPPPGTPFVVGEVGLIPPMHAGSTQFYQRRFTRYNFPAAQPITRVSVAPQITQVGDDYHIIADNQVGGWTNQDALNSDARTIESDLVFRFEGLKGPTGYEFLEHLYQVDDPGNNDAPRYGNEEQPAGPYNPGNNALWTLDVNSAKRQFGVTLEHIQNETPTLSKWLGEKIYSGLSGLGVIATATSEDFFASASVGETENLINQTYIDDTISFTKPETIINDNWDIVAGVMTVSYPDSPALTRWVTDNATRHLREPLVLRAFWSGTQLKDFNVISVGDLAGGVRPLIVMSTGSTKPGGVATSMYAFIIGALGSVQRQIWAEDLKFATVVDNCDEHGDYDGTGYCRFRLLEGDRVISSEPISDSLQYFKSAAVTSNYGFTFKPETTNMNHAANILQSFSLIHDFSVSMDKRFGATGCSASPYGDIYYDCNGNITIHQMVGTASLRAGALQLELQPRDPSQKPVLAELPVGGSFECKLAFFKLKGKQA